MFGKFFVEEAQNASVIRACTPYLSEKTGTVNVVGFSESRIAHVAGFIGENSSRQLLILTSNENSAKKMSQDIRFFSDRKVYYLPGQEPVFFRYDARSHNILEERLNALIHILKENNCIVVSSIDGILKQMTPKDIFIKNIITFQTGKSIDLEVLLNQLMILGYERTHQVEAKRQYSIRGGIIDIFPIDAANPYRIELFDTEIDSIRVFDLSSQRSIENVREIVIYPAQQLIADENTLINAVDRIDALYDEQIRRLSGDSKKRLLQKKEQLIEFVKTRTNFEIFENYMHYFYDEAENLLSYMDPDTIILTEDPDRIKEKVNNFTVELQNDFKYLLEKGETVPFDIQAIESMKDYQKIIKDYLIFEFTPFIKVDNNSEKSLGILNLLSKSVPSFQGRMELFESEMKRYVQRKYKIFIACSTSERSKNIYDFFERTHISSMLYTSAVQSVSEGQIVIGEGSLNTGFEYIEDKIILISDSDIFSNTKTKRMKKTQKDSKPIKIFTDLHVGDYVVHENHGIGKYLGIEQLNIQSTKKDYLKIKYAGEDMLYVPVEQMDLIQKYIGADGGVPKINKLSSSEWRKTKARVKTALMDMAKELLELNAVRRSIKGYAFSQDSPWQKEFEDSFPYEETPDQLKCIEEIKKDMEEETPMDRLLCGDVGYGKTEVAARAVFKCVVDGKQAAVLVPTTILANQHYNTFLERFQKFPFSIEMLSRFRNEKEQRAIMKKVKDGNIDIIIGTHRLLSKDIEFKNLGLLIVDEEQKFGVQHKEAIKMMKKNVDVLTLSATPIPRTLHMSLIGLRDMSTIEEPPEERVPVQTFVIEYEDEIIKEAILREIERGGQVFFVYNRVRGIRRITANLQQLLPGISFAVAHGQMNEKELENIMIGFMEKKYDVLVCTTIIESGIDIQNANTIIIYDADKFGLSQLYQLRGRVGRSNKMAYAYFSYQKDKVLTEQSEKRLRAIKEFTEFGSGFKIAMRDLEIRGAGNLLGVEQHGHMMMIGYELYCKLLEETVKEIQGETFVKLGEVLIEIETNAYIPNYYIKDEVVKIEIYKKIASISSKQEMDEIEDELIDRFGDIPKEVYNLMQIAYIKALSERMGISRVGEEREKLVVEFYETNKMTPYIISGLVADYGVRLYINAGKKPFIKYNYVDYSNKLKEFVVFFERINQLLTNDAEHHFEVQ